jgi:NADPH-dependent glutamate synthase beta subunit-like oxidoreductase/NAD-dependent dihydropyrimidine dehydrogenase PreA subunit
VKTDAGRYVQLIADGRFAEAYRVARAPNPIASICGRTCGAPCEDACRRGKIDAPVAIRPLKRFITENYGPESLSAAGLAQVLRGDMGGGSGTALHGEALLRRGATAPAGGRVAVVGAGPAGLACAHDLALLGHQVTIFEAMPLPGGMMRYGIPSYRLAREVIDHQVAEIEDLGVEIRYGHPLDATFGITELRALGYEAIFLAIGAARGRGIDLPGSDFDGVLKAIDYLLNINRGYRVPVGKRVVVIGGGLVAIDAARMALRAILPGVAMAREEEAAVEATVMRVALDAAREAVRRGAAEVTVVSLESAAEMPAARSVQGREELEIAAGEAITFLPGWGPRRILGTTGRVDGVELVRCVRTTDDDGRFRPVFDEGDTRSLAADAVILAVGQGPDTAFLRPGDGIEVTRSGTIQVDPLTLATSAPDIFAGGDGAFPPALLITAAAQGKTAARSIDAFLRGKPLAEPSLTVRIEELPTDSYRMKSGYEHIERHIPVVPLERRSGICEVEAPYTATEAREQASRCLECHTHPVYDSERCVLCGRCVDICPEHCLRFASLDDVAIGGERKDALAAQHGTGPISVFLYDGDKCIRCGLCAIRCPTAAITMERFEFHEGAVDE